MNPDEYFEALEWKTPEESSSHTAPREVVHLDKDNELLAPIRLLTHRMLLLHVSVQGHASGDGRCGRGGPG